MSPEYLSLAQKRVEAICSPHKQPEDFGYDFRTWVSPYTKGAHKVGNVALVLQDWASADGLGVEPDPDIQLYGRTRNLLTNVRLEQLLREVLGLRLSDVYATNAFPFVKAGGMSASIRRRDVQNAASQFLALELKLANPAVVLALGAVAHSALLGCGVPCIRLPHPAARIGNVTQHERIWRAALSSASIKVRAPKLNAVA